MLLKSFSLSVSAKSTPLLFCSSARNLRVFVSLRRFTIAAESKTFCPPASVAVKAMDSDTPCVLVFSGKSSSELEIAKSLKSGSNTLKLPENSEVKVLSDSGREGQPTGDSFRTDLYFNSLSTNQFGRFLIWSPLVASTHDVVSQNFCDLPLGTVCVADIQIKGRGRSKNIWESPIGCLMFSFTIQMDNGRVVPLLQYVVSLAITEAIKDICNKNGLPYLDVRIKWPNDLYLNGLKVGGILCTSTYKSKKFNVSAALRESLAVGFKFTREEILAAFFNTFETLYSLFIHQGFQTLEELYYQTWLHSGQRVIVQDKNGDQVVENIVTIQGLTSSGYLLAIGDDNQMCELHPDGNSFDFFKGLVRRKLE